MRHEEEKLKIQNKGEDVGKRGKEKQFRDDKNGVRDERKDKAKRLRKGKVKDDEKINAMLPFNTFIL